MDSKNSNVIIAVAMPIPRFPKIFVAIEPARTDANILTMLFPTTIALTTFSGFFSSLSRIFALLSPLFAFSLIVALLIETKAISAPEKNAEAPISKIVTTIPTIIHIMFISDTHSRG